MNYKIAIDGPSGTGKSTIAKALAKKLSFIYIDTGAMYRAVGLYCYRNGIDIDDEEKVVKSLDDIHINIFYKDGVQEIELNGEIVSKAIRENYISKCASVVSAYVPVREKLVAMQRELASNNSVIMDGRDIGTVVLPDSQLKLFMHVDDEVRAQRRYKELLEKGQDVTIEAVREDFKDRDYRDSHRSNSPLKKADDAIEIDNTNITFDEVVDKIYNLFIEKVGKIQ